MPNTWDFAALESIFEHIERALLHHEVTLAIVQSIGADCEQHLLTIDLLGTIDNLSDVAYLGQADIIAGHVAIRCELLQIV